MFSFLPKVKPGCALFHDEGRGAAGALGLVGDGDDRVDLGLAAVGDPLLGAVQDVVVAVELRRGLDAAGVAARVRLGEAEGREILAGRDVGKVFLLLLVASVEEDRVGAEGIGGIAVDTPRQPWRSLRWRCRDRGSFLPRPPYSSGM